MGKCALLQSDVEALGDLADGIMTQVWWAPTFPYVSDLTGVSSSELNEMYKEDNGRVMPQPAAFGYAGLELAVQTFIAAGTTDKQKVYEAIGSLKCQTIAGSVDYSGKMEGLPYSKSVLTGGQWQRDGEYKEGNATKKKSSTNGRRTHQ